MFTWFKPARPNGLQPTAYSLQPISPERTQEILSELASLDRLPLGKAVLDVLGEQIALTHDTVLDLTVKDAHEMFRRVGRLESLEQFRATLLQLQARGRTPQP